MEVVLSPDLRKQLKKLGVRDARLVEKVHRKLKLFALDPKHSSLRTHKLKGGLGDRWSISISKSIRMLYLVTEQGEAYFFDLGTHDEVYQK